MSEIVTVRLPIHSELSDTSEQALQAAVDEAIAQAIADAESEYEVKSDNEVEGAFGGVGEAIIVITLWHLAKAGGIAFAKGAIGAAGAAFVNKYLVPVLQKRNILPGEIKDVSTEAKDVFSEAKDVSTETKDVSPSESSSEDENKKS